MAIAESDEPMFRLLAAGLGLQWPLTEPGWREFQARQRVMLAQLDTSRRRKKLAEDAEFWNTRHAVARAHVQQKAIDVPTVRHSEHITNEVDQFIVRELENRSIDPAPLLDDLPFLRRVSLDVVGQNTK